MKNKIHVITFVILPVILMGLYNNCGRVGFDADMTMNSGSFSFGSNANCEAELKQAYARTWFPVLSTNCNSCHSNAHGSRDLNVSYSAFTTKGTSLISYKASNPHGGNTVNLSSQISGFSGQWSSAQVAYTNCVSSAPTPGNGNSTGAHISLTAKVIPMIETTLTNQNTWRPISWDMESEIPSAFAGQFPAIFSIEARYSLYSGSVVGLEFRNPRMRLKTAQSPSIQVNAIDVSINNSIITNMTTYSALSALVNTTTNMDLAPGASTALAIAPVNSSSLISFAFTNLQSGVSVTTTTLASTTTTMPGSTVVRLSDLLGSNPNMNVFAQSCVSCHSASNAAGGFNITNSTAAIAKANQILARMTNSNAPMPTSGLLNSARVQIVQNWVNGGALP